MKVTTLLERNRHWVLNRTSEDPAFFERHAQQHEPHTMFIGCSDARVPADAVTGSDVGELFVHRNIANQVKLIDTSLVAGLQYAIDVLGVQDIVVCGHHGCGGCKAALGGDAPASVEPWLERLRLLSRVHEQDLAPLDDQARHDRFVEINVDEQVRTLAKHPVVRAAWDQGRPLRLHGWVYRLADGMIEPRITLDGPC